MEAVFEGPLDTCDTDPCLIKQDQQLAIPEYLFAEVEQFVVKELTMAIQVPSDGAIDSQNAFR
jgi:hypothetical protein